MADVAVVGLGRVGLPLALSFADRGLEVIGVERELAVLEQLLGPGLPVGHAAGCDLLQHALLALDADHVEAAIREGERQRQAHPAQTDDRDVHGPESTRRYRRRRSRRYWRANAATKRGLVLR